MQSYFVKPKAFFLSIDSVKPAEPEHFLYGERKSFRFEFLPGTISEGDVLVVCCDNNFDFYNPDPSNLIHSDPVCALSRHEVTHDEAEAQAVEVTLDCRTVAFRDCVDGKVRPVNARLAIYDQSEENYQLLAIGKCLLHPILADYNASISPITDENYYTRDDINSLLYQKVDKEVGKGLSQNDFTDELKDKLDAIDDGTGLKETVTAAQKASWTAKQNAIDSSNPLPASLVSGLSQVSISGSYTDLSNKPSIPSKTSDLVNDSDFQTGTQVSTALLPYSLVTETGARLSMTVDSNYDLVVSLLDKDGNVLSTQDVDLPVESMIINASYANGILTLTLQNGQTISVDISDIVSGLVPDSRTINGHALSSDVTVTASDLSLATVAETGDYDDLSNKPVIPTDTSDLTNGAGFVTAADLATVATTGDYDDLSNLPTIPTDTSDLTNGAGFQDSTEVQNIVDTAIGQLPTIPTDTSELTNGADFQDGTQVASLIADALTMHNN